MSKDSRPPLTPEQKARADKNVATNLCLTVLRSTDAAEVAAAFEHLLDLCFTAIKNDGKSLTIYPTLGDVRMGTDGKHTLEYEKTREAVEDCLIEILAPWTRTTDAELVSGALDCNVFRYIGRDVRHDIVDKIRKQQTRNRSGDNIPVLSLDEAARTDSHGDGGWLPFVDAPQGEASESLSGGFDAKIDRIMRAAKEVLKNNETIFTQTLGSEADVLIEAIKIYPKGYEGNDRDFAAALTVALRRVADVSAHTASAWKKKGLEKIQALKAAGDPALAELAEAIRTGDDSRTLRQTFVGYGRGLRRRSIVLRIPRQN